jgi:protein pelota
VRKVKVKRLSKNSAEIIPETVDDMLLLRLFISKDDLVSAKTTRTVKFEKNYSRHAEKEKKIIILTVRVSEITFDGTFEKLKISGSIEATSDEHVHKGTRHTLEIGLYTKFLLIKEKNQIDFKLLEKNMILDELILVALDSLVAGIGKIKGSQVKYITEIYSNYQGKLYNTKQDWLKSYYEQILDMLISSISGTENKIVIVGPGHVKQGLKNFLENSPIGKKAQILTIEGIEYGGFDGIRQAINSEEFSKVFKENFFTKAKTVMEKILTSLYKDDGLALLSIDEIEKASTFGACENLLITKDFLLKNPVEEEKIVQIFYNILKYKGTIYFLDENTNTGIQLNTIGGIAAYLRYRIR